MSNDKHTPTPWSLEKDFDFILSDYKRDKIVCRFFDQDEEPYINYVANAARIVQCVNEYDELTEIIATLRAEKAELIEALRGAKDELLLFYKKTGTPPRIELDAKIYNALAKYETK